MDFRTAVTSASQPRRAFISVAVCFGVALLVAGFHGRQSAIHQVRMDETAQLAAQIQQTVATNADAPFFLSNPASATNGSAIRDAWISSDSTIRSNLSIRISARPAANDLEVRVAKAILANASGNFNDSLRLLSAEDDRTFASDSNKSTRRQAQILEIRGDAFGAIGQMDRALDCFQKADALEPSELFHLARIADFQFALGKTNEAWAACDKLSAAQITRGDALLLVGKKESALAHYLRAAEIESKVLDANSSSVRWRDLALAYQRQGRAELLLSQGANAWTDFEKALNIIQKLSEDQTNRTQDELARIYRDLAAAALLQGKVAEAAQDYQKSIAPGQGIDEELPNLEGVKTHNNMGSCLLAQQKFDLAETEFATAISSAEKLAPEDRAEEIKIELAIARNNRGVLHRARKQDEAALNEFETAIALLAGPQKMPRSATNISTNGPAVLTDVLFGYSDRGFEVIARSRLASSPDRRAITLAANLKNKGHAEVSLGREAAAQTDFSQAIQLYGTLFQDNSEKDLNLPLARTLLPLAWIYATSPRDASRDAQRAEVYAYKACELSDWKLPLALETLAAAYAEGKNFADAIKCQRQVVQLASPRQKPDQIARLELYQQGKQYRAAP